MEFHLLFTSGFGFLRVRVVLSKTRYGLYKAAATENEEEEEEAEGGGSPGV